MSKMRVKELVNFISSCREDRLRSGVFKRGYRIWWLK